VTKILFMADLHACQETLEQAEKCFACAIQKGVDERVDLLAFAGDFWDSRVINVAQSPLLPMVDLVKWAGDNFPCIFVRGTHSHDQDGSLRILGRLNTHHPIRISEESEQFVLTGIQISTLPAPNKAILTQDGGNPTAALQKILTNFGAKERLPYDTIPRILLGHITVKGVTISQGQVILGDDLAVSKTDLELAKADFVGLGHIHEKEQPLLGSVGNTDSPMQYAGSTYYRNFGEANDSAKGFWIVEIGEGRVHKQFYEAPSRKKVLLELHLEAGDLASAQKKAFMAEIDAAMGGQPSNLSGADVKFRYFLPPEGNGEYDENQTREVLQKAGVHSVIFERRLVPVERVRVEGISRVRTLREKVSLWGEATEQEIPEGVLEKADQLEREDHESNL